MNEQRSDEGGAANMPPFPRLVDEDAAPMEEGGSPPRAAADAIGPSDADEPEEELRIVTEAVARPVIERPLSEGVAATSGRPEMRATPAAIEEGESRVRRLADRAGAEVKRRADQRVNRGVERIADRLDEAAERIERIATTQAGEGGTRARAAGAARSASGSLEDVAEYLRSNDFPGMRADLERQVREKPIQSLLVAVGAGWILGKILR